MDNMKVIVDHDQIQQHIKEVAEKLNQRYQSDDNLMIIVLLQGGKRFADDLVKYLSFEPSVEYMTASSYHGDTQTSGTVKISSEIDGKIAGKDVLLVDDIYDTGLTLKAVTDYIWLLNPASISTCVLLEKQKKHRESIPVDFCGMKIEDSFLIGYGLDFEGKYRDLPYIAIMQEE